MKAVIFDMDGVIVDSEPLHVKAEKEVCRRYNILVKDSDWETFKGKTTIDIFSFISKKYNPNIDPKQMADAKLEIYLELASKQENLKIYSGFFELISCLRQKYKIALTTSSVRQIQECVFSHYGLFPFFDVIVNGSMVSKGKPDPEPYSLTISRLGLKPEDCFVIEDSDNGVISAKRAGAKVIAVTHSFPKEKLKEADYIVDSLLEVKELLEKGIIK